MHRFGFLCVYYQLCGCGWYSIHDQAYIARLDDPASGTFQQCAIDVFDVIGPCLGKICHLHLHRSGSDGWVPERVIVDDYYYGPIAFEYNIDIPEGGGLGLNYCG